MTEVLVPHELHLTLGSLDPNRIGEFVAFCTSRGGKAILIELPRGNVQSQPMFTKVEHVADLAAAKAVAEEISKELNEKEFFSRHTSSRKTWRTHDVTRIKIEVPMDCAPETAEIGLGPLPFNTYFEWHGKVPYKDVERLTALCLTHNAHLSRNALSTDIDHRFVTLRDYASKISFTSRVALLVSALEANQSPIKKSQFEYCSYDSLDHFDRGWLDGGVGFYLRQMIVCEAFIRRAALVGGPFMLKGSYAGRYFFPRVENRFPEDLDWVCLTRLDDVASAHAVFSQWALAVTETQLDDGVVFTSFSKNAFWRSVDYAMSDDFPTTNTDLTCTVDGIPWPRLKLELSFNQDLPVAPVELAYTPLRGTPFTVPKSTPLSLQVAWKLHQTLVRPRFKDFHDLNNFLRHQTFDANVREEAVQALIDACHADKVDAGRLHDFTHGNWDKLFDQPTMNRAWDVWQQQLKQMAGDPELSQMMPIVGEFADFKLAVTEACRLAGLDSYTEEHLRSIPARVNTWRRVENKPSDPNPTLASRALAKIKRFWRPFI